MAIKANSMAMKMNPIATKANLMAMKMDSKATEKKKSSRFSENFFSWLDVQSKKT